MSQCRAVSLDPLADGVIYCILDEDHPGPHHSDYVPKSWKGWRIPKDRKRRRSRGRGARRMR